MKKNGREKRERERELGEAEERKLLIYTGKPTKVGRSRLTPLTNIRLDVRISDFSCGWMGFFNGVF